MLLQSIEEFKTKVETMYNDLRVEIQSSNVHDFLVPTLSCLFAVTIPNQPVTIKPDEPVPDEKEDIEVVERVEDSKSDEEDDMWDSKPFSTQIQSQYISRSPSPSLPKSPDVDKSYDQLGGVDFYDYDDNQCFTQVINSQEESSQPIDDISAQKDTEKQQNATKQQNPVEVITDEEPPCSQPQSQPKLKLKKTRKKKGETAPLATTKKVDHLEESFYHSQEVNQDQNSGDEEDTRGLSDSDSETRVIDWSKKNQLKVKLVSNVMHNGQSKGKKKTTKKKKNASDNESDKPEVPDFDSMPIHQLKSLLSQYGVKPGTKKSMVEKLQQIHKAVN
ncbi:hypothetical protein AKO1_012686 [Acrasis kona]|uniref:SAP domain-containing protein n=1 Tax=Acrasis kona TaxID=1008807 RepID=A0AAW2YW92_9EUKA